MGAQFVVRVCLRTSGKEGERLLVRKRKGPLPSRFCRLSGFWHRTGGLSTACTPRSRCYRKANLRRGERTVLRRLDAVEESVVQGWLDVRVPFI
ncbi:hypothetical protein CBR_g23364 [Chara braunii]|uniref:Uncharacterized protein n=1 Tax=Chara braunii TaxID=69332 RepID=A0A388L471_CHABU|nr:hypothetical protein CBR_g23364 [Chara braunii]|eukprot:GBG77038.1 hypothetical protein CBR_g23364 [Chara braunii]